MATAGRAFELSGALGEKGPADFCDDEARYFLGEIFITVLKLLTKKRGIAITDRFGNLGNRHVRTVKQAFRYRKLLFDNKIF